MLPAALSLVLYFMDVLIADRYLMPRSESILMK